MQMLGGVLAGLLFGLPGVLFGLLFGVPMSWMLYWTVGMVVLGGIASTYPR